MAIGKISLNKIKINSLALALVLIVDAMCYTFPALGIGTFYVVGYAIEAIALAMLFLVKLGSDNFSIKKGSKVAALYFLVICIAFIITKMVGPDTDYSLLSFIYFFVVSIFVVCRDVNTESVLKYITVASILTVFAYNSIFAYQFVTLNQASMGAVYSVLPIATAGVIHFIYYRQNEKKLFYIFYIPIIILLFGIITYANRGTVLSFIVLILVIAMNRPQNFRGDVKVISNKKRIAMLAVCIVGFIAVLNFNEIFLALYNVASEKFGTLPSIFVKMNKYIGLDDISNGRSEVYEAAINYIKQSPFFGYGIETFESYTNYPYPHNFVLQLIFEGGLLFAIIPTAAIIISCIRLFFSQMKDENLCVILMLLIVQVIPRFLVSATIWRSRCFWILVFMVLYKYKHIILNKENMVL